jgi:hypothetical protein
MLRDAEKSLHQSTKLRWRVRVSTFTMSYVRYRILPLMRTSLLIPLTACAFIIGKGYSSIEFAYGCVAANVVPLLDYLEILL